VWRWLVLLAGCGRIGFAARPDGAPLTYRDAVLADHPVAYWRLDDVDATASDVIGSFPGTYSGTCMHGAQGALADDPDTATHFNGGCNMSANNAPSFAGNAAFSIELWFLSDSALQDTYPVMKETRNTAMNQPIDGYALVVQNLSGGAFLERVVAGVDGGTSAMPLPPQGFHHLVATYDGAQAAMYVDAALVSMRADNRALAATGGPLQVGGFSPPLLGPTKGTLDEIAIYDYALAATRIAVHHDIGVTGPMP
jgi:hypothetical protein